MNRITGVTFIILNSSGKALMQLRDLNSKRYANMWCFPGGTIEPDEDSLATVIREAKEEYNLEIKITDCVELMVYDLPYDVSAKVYICKLYQDQNPVLNEGADMKWMEIDKIENLQLGFGQRVIVPKLKEFLQNVI
ncbi:MAG: NUDIX domain-containing protein [Minisyncoccia bacterium]|jgi:mutator protein MutT